MEVGARPRRAKHRGVVRLVHQTGRANRAYLYHRAEAPRRCVQLGAARVVPVANRQIHALDRQLAAILTTTMSMRKIFLF